MRIAEQDDALGAGRLLEGALRGAKAVAIDRLPRAVGIPVALDGEAATQLPAEQRIVLGDHIVVTAGRQHEGPDERVQCDEQNRVEREQHEGEGEARAVAAQRLGGRRGCEQCRGDREPQTQAAARGREQQQQQRGEQPDDESDPRDQQAPDLEQRRAPAWQEARADPQA
jgi:hypothetical protein